MITVVHTDATSLEKPKMNGYTQGLILLSEPFQFFVFGLAPRIIKYTLVCPYSEVKQGVDGAVYQAIVGIEQNSRGRRSG
jgi:hypothetical protein